MYSVTSDGKEYSLTSVQAYAAKEANEDFLGRRVVFIPFDHRNVKTETLDFVLTTLKIQADLDLKVDGVFGPKTLAEYEKVYGPILTDIRIPSAIHSAPRWVKRWGYYHAHTFDQHPDSLKGVGSTWPMSSLTWHNIVNKDSWLAAMFRLVSGYNNNPANPLYDRPLTSAITLDTISIGFDHTWLGTLSKRFRIIRDSISSDLSLAIISETVNRTVQTLDYLIEKIDAATKTRGKQPLVYGSLADTIAKEWIFNLSQKSFVVAAYMQAWVDTYVKSSVRLIKAYGWNANDGVTLAAVTRMQNSAQANFTRYTTEAKENGINTKDSAKTLEFIYKRLYKHPERLDVIKRDPDFKLKPNTDVETLFN